MGLERRGCIVQLKWLVNQQWDESMMDTKPFRISRRLVFEAWKRVKANGGAQGIDSVTIECFESNLSGNLYKIWNRMSSGSYFPPPVRRVDIPKDNGATRPLGIPTVGDRVAQMVVKMVLEPELEPIFHPDSYGYRPGKSAIQAVQQARERCWFKDSKGLVVKSRSNLAEHKLPYAHDYPACDDFLEAVRALKPTAILGLSGQPNTFTKDIVEAMAKNNDRPVIFALSNPTSKAECTAEDAYTWSDGRAIFASGSPFDPVNFGQQTFVPGQGNNAYIFPGVGLGVIASQARTVTDEMFLAAARSLANQVNDSDIERGRVYPSLSRIRQVSATIAYDVARIAYRNGLTDKEEPDDLMADIHSHMYQPIYPHFA